VASLAAVARTAAALRRARAERDAAIYAAYRGGATQEQIAAVVGLSRSQVGRIISAEILAHPAKADRKGRT